MPEGEEKKKNEESGNVLFLAYYLKQRAKG